MFKTTAYRAIECANIVRINNYEIDDYKPSDHEYVLGCPGTMQFKIVDPANKEVEVDDEGNCTLLGYEREDLGDLPWTEACLNLELWKTRPINEADCK